MELSKNKKIKLIKAAFKKKYGHYPRKTSQNEMNHDIEQAENDTDKTMWPGMGKNI